MEFGRGLGVGLWADRALFTSITVESELSKIEITRNHPSLCPVERIHVNLRAYRTNSPSRNDVEDVPPAGSISMCSTTLARVAHSPAFPWKRQGGEEETPCAGRRRLSRARDDIDILMFPRRRRVPHIALRIPRGTRGSGVQA
jgi:hypothetical protein